MRPCYEVATSNMGCTDCSVYFINNLQRTGEPPKECPTCGFQFYGWRYKKTDEEDYTVIRKVVI